MGRLGVALIVLFALTSLSVVTVEANKYNIGSMITWVDPKVSNMLGVMWRFKDYGCNCGTNRSGKPLDQVDCCCQAHNECYDKLVRDQTCPSDPFGKGYSYKKVKENGKPTFHCTSTPEDSCAQQLCLCDATVAECFAANEPHYNSRHKSYSQALCNKRDTTADFCENDNIRGHVKAAISKAHES